jgi:hypothetical protein
MPLVQFASALPFGKCSEQLGLFLDQVCTMLQGKGLIRKHGVELLYRCHYLCGEHVSALGTATS